MITAQVEEYGGIYDQLSGRNITDRILSRK